ncbi:hypothetical protein SteCoe_11757 [Stentor coeruleus]|uniref:Uncharacterized protein n=1 Tax=Stentor coeruleus TaxID=5963 RepID=A0A1R2CCF1_9CILI|nr:hypothetical protein SteCoe_11757 [Stentor coeruleus]
MHLLLICFKCFKRFGLSKTHAEKDLEIKVPNSINPNEIEVNFKDSADELKLETERNYSNIEGTVNENDVFSFGASSIKYISDVSSSFSDIFEMRGVRGHSPIDNNTSHQFVHKNISLKSEQSSCLELRPPKNFAFANVIQNN